MSRTPFLALLLPATLALAACGGTKHIGEITPTVTERVSGAWILNVEESDDPAQAMGRAGEGRGARAGGGERGGRMPPGGGGGGFGGGMSRGRMPAGGGMRGGAGARRTNPAAMRAMRELATTTPTRIDIALTDSLVTVTYAGREPWVLPWGKTVKRDLGEDLELQAKAEWDQERLIVHRNVAGGGGVTETFMPSVDGTRLTVDVELAGGPGGVEFQRVYNHPKPATGGGTS